jgi:hypothetical protein
MGTVSRSEPRVNVGVFVPDLDDAPYLATEVESRLFSVTLLPPAPLHQLLDFSFLQSSRNGLRSLLVLEGGSCIALERSGRVQAGRALPVDLTVRPFGLAPCAEIPTSDAMMARTERLMARWAEQDDRPVGRDPLKGGHLASEEERADHRGLNPSGVPTGLALCEECGEWCGWCLDPAAPEPTLVPVYCSCLNATRCAACEEPFAARTVHGCWWDPEEQRPRYVPGSLAFAHRCEEG